MPSERSANMFSRRRWPVGRPVAAAAAARRPAGRKPPLPAPTCIADAAMRAIVGQGIACRALLLRTHATGREVGWMGAKESPKIQCGTGARQGARRQQRAHGSRNSTREARQRCGDVHPPPIDNLGSALTACLCRSPSLFGCFHELLSRCPRIGTAQELEPIVLAVPLGQGYFESGDKRYIM